MKYEKDYCTDCKKALTFSGKGTFVNAWKLYCEHCYNKRIKEGKIIPPSHEKILLSFNKNAKGD